MALKLEIEANFQVIRDRSSADELTFICPQPGCRDATGNRSVSLKNGKTSCWLCNVGGDFLAWANRLGYDIHEDESKAVEVDELDNMLDELEPAKNHIPSSANIQLPQGFTPLDGNLDSAYASLIGQMATRKGLDLDDFVKVGAGFTRTNPLWEPFCIFPVFEWDRLVYYQGRTYVDVDKKTKKFPSRAAVPLGARYWVYNIDQVRKRQGEVVVVVESILNVLSLEKLLLAEGVTEIVPVCVFKHAISTAQISKILACRGVKEVNFMFDSDSTAEAWTSAAGIINRCASSVTVLPPAEDGRKQDPNDNPALALECLVDRQVYSSAKDLEYRLSSSFTHG